MAERLIDGALFILNRAGAALLALALVFALRVAAAVAAPAAADRQPSNFAEQAPASP